MKNKNLDGIKKIKKTRKTVLAGTNRLDSLKAAIKLPRKAANPVLESGPTEKPAKKSLLPSARLAVQSCLKLKACAGISYARLRIFSDRISSATKNYILANYQKFLKKTFISLAYLFGLGVVFFIASSLIILRFRIDNGFSKKINSAISLPAVISNRGILPYEEYLSVYYKVRSAAWQGKLEDAVAAASNERLITRSLLEKNGLAGQTLSKEEMEIMVLADKDINRTGLARIGKIRRSIDKGESFDDIYWRYGDAYSKAERMTKDAVLSRFGNNFSDLEEGSVSGILTGKDGYYIAKVLDKEADELELRYVFIAGETFAQYMVHELQSLKTWMLVH